jgi:hypothetical protein
MIVFFIFLPVFRWLRPKIHRHNRVGALGIHALLSSKQLPVWVPRLWEYVSEAQSEVIAFQKLLFQRTYVGAVKDLWSMAALSGVLNSGGEDKNH